MMWQRKVWLAEAAALERDVRERKFPELVASGRVTHDDAEAELAAWRAIADIMDRGETAREISWSTLHLYTSRCLQALEADVKKMEQENDQKPCPERCRRVLNRRAMVDAIHQPIARQKYLIDDTSTLLRERAARKARAA